MHRFVVIFMLIVVVIRAQEREPDQRRRKWSDRQVFNVSSGNPENPERRTWGPDRPVWGSVNIPSNPANPSSEIPSSTNKPTTERPKWMAGLSWGSDRPQWGPVNPGSRVVQPGVSTRAPTKDDTCVPSPLPLTVESRCCGVDAISNDRIIGGNITHIEEHPWLVQIEYLNVTQLRRLCGGSLISNRYVLSAAHCFRGDILKLGKPVNVILGEYDSRNEGQDCIVNDKGATVCTDGAIKVPIESYRIHNDYWFDNYRNLNDISLVRLSRPVEYTKFIRPICLPSADVTVSPTPDLRFITAGWGAIKHEFIQVDGRITAKMEFDDIKRDVDVPLIPNTQCREQFKFLTERHMCAGGEAGKDSCKGDSGGPLMHQKDGIFEAVGIVSTASGRYPCGTANHVAVYTNIFQYRDWINKYIKP